MATGICRTPCPSYTRRRRGVGSANPSAESITVCFFIYRCYELKSVSVARRSKTGGNRQIGFAGGNHGYYVLGGTGVLPNMTRREHEIRFHKDEAERLKDAKDAEGLGDLPLAAYCMRLLDSYERRAAFAYESDD